MKNIRRFFISLFLGAAASAIAGTATYEAQPSPTPQDENSHDLFDYEMDYTLNSNFYDDHGKFGNGDSLYNDFSYAHRFLITGKWYFRAGVEYERFDFDGPPITVCLTTSRPFTLYWLWNMSCTIMPARESRSIPAPISKIILPAIQSTFPGKCSSVSRSRKIKIFGVIGLGGSLYQNPIVAPGGGLIWLFTDKFRLEGVFPKPALVYNLTDDWEFRILGNLFYESFRTDDVITPRGNCKSTTPSFNTAKTA